MSLRPDLITEPILLRLSDSDGMLSWPDTFANKNPVELEIGAGKGTFLLHSAQSQPTSNFVGIEWAKAYAEFAADRLRRHQCLNARIVHGEALWWIRCHVPPDSLSVVHVYFPDPWPKARHHKRRLIQPFFLEQVFRILRPGGQIKVVTDHAEYFEHISEVFGLQTMLDVIPFVSPLEVTRMRLEHEDEPEPQADIPAATPSGPPAYLSPATKTAPDSARPAASGLLVGTNFERKYVAQGRSFHAIAARKPS